jgi:hypothetical protein
MKYLFVPALVVAFVFGLTFGRMHPSVARADAANTKPTDGWTLHIDADQHFGDAHPNEIAHHYCKPVTGGVIECQLYDSDAPDARLVGIETIVPDKVWATFPASEQALWHYHKVELAKIHATLPGLSPAEQAKVIASILPTYGKVWVIWDPLANANPVGQPTVVVLK